MLTYILAFVVAFVLSLLLTPLARRLAFRLGSVHYPKAISIDTHVDPIPYLGGVPIFVAFMICAFLFVMRGMPIFWVMVAALIVAGGALIDDARALSVAGKFISQIIAAVLILVTGAKIIEIPTIFGNEFIDSFIIFVWLVGMMNAINFLDIMDGLSGGVSGLAALGFAGVAILIDQPVIAVMALALAGGTAGFLVFNFNPARIFMGDMGSQFLGFMLAIFPLMLLKQAPAELSTRFIVVSLVVLGVALFEMTYTSTIRVLTGKAPWKGSKDHFALRSFAMGYSVRQIVLAAYGVGALLAVLGMWMLNAQAVWIVPALAILLVGAAIFSVWISRVPVPRPPKAVTVAHKEAPAKLERAKEASR